MSPGTIVTGIRIEPDICPARRETSGPGPSFSGEAPNTRTRMLSSSSIKRRISSSRSPSRMTYCGIMPAAAFTSPARPCSNSSASWRASSRIRFSTAIQCWKSAGSSTRSIVKPPPVFFARRLANRNANRHSGVSSTTTRNFVRHWPCCALSVMCRRPPFDNGAMVRQKRASLSAEPSTAPYFNKIFVISRN